MPLLLRFLSPRQPRASLLGAQVTVSLDGQEPQGFNYKLETSNLFISICSPELCPGQCAILPSSQQDSHTRQQRKGESHTLGKTTLSERSHILQMQPFSKPRAPPGST